MRQLSLLLYGSLCFLGLVLSSVNADVDEISACWEDRSCLVVAVRPTAPYAMYVDPNLSVSFNCTSGSCSNITGLSIELWDTLLSIANDESILEKFIHRPLRYTIMA